MILGRLSHRISNILVFVIAALVALSFSCRKQTTVEHNTFPKPTFDDSIQYSILGEGKLVFERIGPIDNAYNGVCVIDIDQQRKWEITGDIMNDPAVAPDGKKIAYSNWYSDSTWYDIFIMNIDGTDRYDINKMVYQDNCPSWTFDGSKIIFTNHGNVEASYKQSPVPKPSDRVKIIDYATFNPPYIYPPEGPVSSAVNGKLMVQATGIRTFDPDGTNMKLIIPTNDNSDHLMYSPAWSPDGSKIALLSFKMNSDIAVILFNQDGTNADTLVSLTASGNVVWSGQNNEFSLCWSPDGSQIAFTRPDGSKDGGVGSHIYVVKTDHTGLRQVTFSPGVTDMSLSWSK